MSDLLRVKATCRESLQMASALVQDALVPRASLAFNPEESRFVGHLFRFMWENLDTPSTDDLPSTGRISSTLVIDNVQSVHYKNFPHEPLDLVLLTIDQPSPDHLRLLFSEGPELLLQTQGAIEVFIADTPHVWPTSFIPDHALAV